MPTRPVLVDTTRLLTRLKHRSPTGIDRVDLAYANRFLSRPGSRAVTVTRFGMRLMPDPLAHGVLGRVGERWGETREAAQDPVLEEIRRRLSGQGQEPTGLPPPPGDGRTRARSPVWAHLAEERLKALAPLWRHAADAPRDAIYLHTSHLRLERPHLFAWLSQRPDIRPVFFVHDIIPIDYPEYGVPGEDARHRVRMNTVSRHAAAVIVNSDDVGARLAAFLAREGWRAPPIHVAHLGVEPVFAGEPVFSHGVAETETLPPYFVVCSTIEARKNHLLLLQVWRELAELHGDATPKLVVVGRRGWESEAAADLLDRCPGVRRHVVEASGLSSAGLAELVQGARALLMPSFAEGYGIPIVEALTLGTPVIASDIPVHREVAGTRGTFLHPLDGPGWRDAVRAATAASPPRIADYAPPGWDDHFRIVEACLGRL